MVSPTGADSSAGSFARLMPTFTIFIVYINCAAFLRFSVAFPSQDVDPEASLPGRHLFFTLARAVTSERRVSGLGIKVTSQRA